MANDLNNVAVVGRLTRDPELRSLSGGTSVCQFSVAINGSKKVNDKWEDYPNFINVTVFGARAETVTQYCKKGDRVGVAGRLEQQRWEDDHGGKRERVLIVADNVSFLTTKAEREGSSSREKVDW